MPNDSAKNSPSLSNVEGNAAATVDFADTELELAAVAEFPALVADVEADDADVAAALALPPAVVAELAAFVADVEAEEALLPAFVALVDA